MVTPRSRSGRSRRCRRLLSLFYLDWWSPRCTDDCASAAPTVGRDVAIGGAAAKSSLGLAAAAFVASLSSFQFGYATGILNVPQRIITTDLGLDKDSMSWAVVVSIWALGGLLGAQVAAVVADSRGRRPLLALSGLTCGASGLVAFCAGTASLAAGSEPVGGRSALCLLVLSRFISGGGCGMATVAAPLYLGEIATTETRGALGSLAQLSVVVAIVVAQGLAALITLQLGLHWRLVLGLPAFIGAAQLALLPLLPETPRYLLSRGFAQEGEAHDEAREARSEARSEAREALRLLRPRGGQASEAVEAELAALEQELGAGAGGGGRRGERRGVLLLWRDSASLRLPLLNAAAMMIGQQLSGINAVFYYSTTFFSSAGLDSPVAGTLLASAVNVLAMLASSAMMECAGRRRLLLVGIGGMFLSSVGVTAALIGKARASAHHEEDWSLNGLSVFFVLCFVVAFELGPGPIPWQIGAEIFPEHARAAAMSAAAALNWVCNAAVGLGFPAMSSALGSLVFLPFAAVLLLWLLFTARFTPETRGRSVDEIQVEFRRLAALGSRKPARAEGDGVPLSSIRQPQG